MTKSDGTQSLVPCKRQVTNIEYRHEGKEKKYRCYSNQVSLSFAQTIHEVQGQTLGRVILILGRHVGRNVGRISWSLLYVALSRVKKLDHIKFFPCGRRSTLECFMHLTKLKPTSKFVKWKKGYKNHMWDPIILEKQQLRNERIVESKLRDLGRNRTLILKKDLLIAYLRLLGYGKLYKLNKGPLQHKLNNHMVRKRVWEATDDDIERPTKRRCRKSSNALSSRKNSKKRKGSIVEFVDEKSEGINIELDAPQKKKKLCLQQKKKNKPLLEQKKKKKKVCVEQKKKKTKPVVQQKKKKTKPVVQQKKKKKKVINIDPIFQQAMKNQLGFEIREIGDDGNCLFRAVADQIYGNQELHSLLRDKCCNYMELHRERFRDFIDTEVNFSDFSHYINNMRVLKTWGGNLEIAALSELYQRRVEVYDQRTVPRSTFSESVNFDNDYPPIRVTFKNGNHYNSVLSDDIAQTLLNEHQAGEFEDAVLASLNY